MTWLNPWAAVGLVSIAAPILIHLLTARRARPLAFPTLRFVVPTRLAAFSRHRLDERLLLAVRITILTAAATAFAGPLAMTAGRKAAWSARTARAIVVHTGDGVPGAATPRRDRAAGEAASAFASSVVHAGDLRDGVRRALTWLDTAPPARRELVVLSSFPLGAIDGAIVREIPADVGVRLVRIGDPPGARVQPDWDAVWTADTARSRTVSLRDRFTKIDEQPVSRAVPMPVEIVTSPGGAATAQAALAAALDARVTAPAAGRRATIVIGADAVTPAPAAQPVTAAWIADASARLARDEALRGLPIECAQRGDRFLVTARMPLDSAATPLLVRAVFESLRPAARNRTADVLAVADAALRGFERAPAAPWPPDRGRVDEDDRRWLWGFVLIAMAVESLVRRRRAAAEPRRDGQEAGTRVA
jgi:aerotolerance regulator-like protein